MQEQKPVRWEGAYLTLQAGPVCAVVGDGDRNTRR